MHPSSYYLARKYRLYRSYPRYSPESIRLWHPTFFRIFVEEGMYRAINSSTPRLLTEQPTAPVPTRHP